MYSTCTCVYIHVHIRIYIYTMHTYTTRTRSAIYIYYIQLELIYIYIICIYMYIYILSPACFAAIMPCCSWEVWWAQVLPLEAARQWPMLQGRPCPTVHAILAHVTPQSIMLMHMHVHACMHNACNPSHGLTIWMRWFLRCLRCVLLQDMILYTVHECTCMLLQTLPGTAWHTGAGRVSGS